MVEDTDYKRASLFVFRFRGSSFNEYKGNGCCGFGVFCSECGFFFAGCVRYFFYAKKSAFFMQNAFFFVETNATGHAPLAMKISKGSPPS
jgi:hypothetical protein